MNIRNIRNFVIEKVNGVVTSDVLVYADGDVSKPDAAVTRVRVKVLPNETSKPGVGIGGMKEGAGLVQVDLFGPQAIENARDNLEDLGQAIVEAIPFITHTLEDGKTLHVWSVWVDQVLDEKPYFHIPVFVRWTLHHT